MERNTAPSHRLLSKAFAETHPEAREALVDRLLPIAGDLYRLRLRWRGRRGSEAAGLGLRWGDGVEAAARCRRETSALRLCADAGVPAPQLWLDRSGDEPPFVAFEWVEGETFAGAWRRRRREAAPELLGTALAEIHQRTPLCHGAFYPRHVLVEPSGNILAVSWHRAAPGDQTLDLARASVHLADEFGGVLRTPFLRAYRSIRPVAPDDLARMEAEVRGSLESRNEPVDPHGHPRRRRDASRPD
jgi:aminoglycoside phosphotransferase (APT) family kinase protein